MTDLLARKRRAIDALDSRLAGLLAKRLAVARSLAGLKTKVRDPRREAEVLENAAARVADAALRRAVAAVYREILRQSRLLQKKP